MRRKPEDIISSLKLEGDWLVAPQRGRAERRASSQWAETIYWSYQARLVRGHHAAELGEVHLAVSVYVRL